MQDLRSRQGSRVRNSSGRISSTGSIRSSRSETTSSKNDSNINKQSIHD